MPLTACRDAAPALRLQGPDGSDVSVDRLWQERTTVLFFLRHFG